MINVWNFIHISQCHRNMSLTVSCSQWGVTFNIAYIYAHFNLWCCLQSVYFIEIKTDDKNCFNHYFYSKARLLEMVLIIHRKPMLLGCVKINKCTLIFKPMTIFPYGLRCVICIRNVSIGRTFLLMYNRNQLQCNWSGFYIIHEYGYSWCR